MIWRDLVDHLTRQLSRLHQIEREIADDWDPLPGLAGRA
jgi:hypothetical protein